MNFLLRQAGGLLARYLNRCARDYEPFAASDPETLRRIMQPGDVLLVEGNRRVSTAIKYMTQSTWSHAALYIGEDEGGSDAGDEALSLVEADLNEGVIAVPLSKYELFNTRICRPVRLTSDDCDVVVRFVKSRIGMDYDLKNVLDLLRYLLPTPPVPVRFRRRMIALGSGDPTRAICSTLIAEAFQRVGYPILPEISVARVKMPFRSRYVEKEIMHIRHHSLFTPRDFDVSPFFAIIKPTIEKGFDYKEVTWDTDVEIADSARPIPAQPPGC